MRIDQLVLRRYGHFTDFSLDFSANGHTEFKPGDKQTTKPDFHILYGANEAGKSTTLAAITDLLYGFERVTPWKFLHGNELLEIEASLNQATHSVAIKRFKNHLTNNSNDRLASFPLDLQGLSRDDYRQRFSFDEKTLKDGGDQILNSQGDVGQALFSASSGLADFSNRLESILAPSNSFWTPGRKSKLQLNDLKKALQENKSQLNNLKLDVKAWQLQQAELTKASTELTDARDQKSTITDRIKTLENQVSLHAIARKWMLRKNTLNELLTLGIVTTSKTQTLDLSSEEKINQAVDDIRQKLQYSQISESKLTDLKAQLVSTKQLLETISLSDRDQLFLNTKDAIHKLADSASAAIEWEHQQREINSELEICDELINEHSSAIGLSGDLSVAEQLPSESQLDGMTQLLSEHLSVSDRLRQTQEELIELKQQVPEDHEIPSAVDTTETITIVADVLRRVLQENLVNQTKTAIDDELNAKKELYACAQELGVSTDSIDEFQLPDERMVFYHLDQLSKYAQAVEQLTQDAMNAETEISSSKQKISELVSLGAVDETTFNQSKAFRDSAWSRHTEQFAAEIEISQLRKSAEHFEKALNAHDEVTTLTLSNVKQNAELKLFAQQLKRHENFANSTAEKLNSSRSKLDKTTEEIKALISPFYAEHNIDNDLVRERLGIAARLKELSIKFDGQRMRVEDFKRQCETQRKKLLIIVSSIETESTLQQLDALELQDLMYQVEKSVDRKRQTASEEQSQVAQRNLHTKNIDRTKAKVARCEQELNDWESRWTVLSNQSGIKELSIDSAKESIPLIRKLIETNSRKKASSYKLKELTGKIENRNQTLDALLKTLSTDSLSRAVNELNSVVERAVETTQHSTRFKATEAAIADVLEKGLQDKNILESLCNECGANTPARLIELLQNTAKYRAAESSNSEELEQMEKISGTAPTSESIELLVEHFNIQETQDILTELSIEFQQSESLYDERYGAWVLADRALREIGDNNEYALLHQERSNILLEIEEGARNTAVALVGERVLKSAINKFRQKHQSVLLTEAQEAFSTLTLGNYTHLVPRDDGRGNERLFAIDINNKARAVEELSTGTRYQLYLALRAAAHADYARMRTPLPFVADDIMESFDDERSAAAFQVLGNMAKNGQVLYLTHHQHLIPIAQQILGSANVKIHHLGQ